MGLVYYSHTTLFLSVSSDDIAHSLAGSVFFFGFSLPFAYSPFFCYFLQILSLNRFSPSSDLCLFFLSHHSLLHKGFFLRRKKCTYTKLLSTSKNRDKKKCMYNLYRLQCESEFSLNTFITGWQSCTICQSKIQTERNSIEKRKKKKEETTFLCVSTHRLKHRPKILREFHYYLSGLNDFIAILI